MNTKTTNNTLMKGKGEAVNADLLVIPPPNTFLNIDCMALMKEMPDKYIDLAIVDPPYGINITKIWGDEKYGYKNYKEKEWDASPPPQEYFNELLRVSKNQIIWGGNYFANNLPNSSCWLIWDKGQRNFALADAELAWTSMNKSVRIYELSRAKAKADNGNDKIHPTQKPVSLYRWTLKKFAKAGDLILDTHVGSGSSLVACKELGFDYYGTEIDKEYYEGACKRIDRAFRQFDLNLQ